MDALQRLIAALWLGSAFFLMLSASAAFRAAGNTTMAADVVGAILTRWHYIALAAPLALFALELRRSRPLILLVLFVAILLAAGQALVDLRIRAIRQSTATAISALDPTDPLRRRFGALHGLSMVLLLTQTILAAGVVVAGSARKGDPVVAMPTAPIETPVDTVGGGPPPSS
jgi:hypothetical protein